MSPIQTQPLNRDTSPQAYVLRLRDLAQQVMRIARRSHPEQQAKLCALLRDLQAEAMAARAAG